LSVSLGWESSAIVNLKRKTVQGYIDRANSENKKYFYFMSQRQKTGSLRLGVLNPLALEWVSKWLIKSENKKKRKRWEGRNPQERISDVFDLGIKGLNRMLQTLTKQSQIKTTGRIHTHLLRKWVMGSLVKAGMNEWEVKFLVGKAIPATDFTYLQTLQNSIESKYPEAFEKYLNLETSSQSIIELSKSLEEKDSELKSQKIQLKKLQENYLLMQKRIKSLSQIRGTSDLLMREILNDPRFQKLLFDKVAEHGGKLELREDVTINGKTDVNIHRLEKEDLKKALRP